MFMLTYGSGKQPIHLQESKPSIVTESLLTNISGGTNKGCDWSIFKPEKPSRFHLPYVYACTLSYFDLII